jgi:hypothetical protein
MRKNDFLEPDITLVADCHTCGEMVRFGLVRCPTCGMLLDLEEIFPSAVVNFLITQACSSANSIRTFDVAIFFFLGVSASLYLYSLFFNELLWFHVALNAVLSVVWLLPVTLVGRWFYKHGRWRISDPEYEFAKKEMRAGLKLWLAAHIFNAIVIYAGWVRANG